MTIETKYNIGDEVWFTHDHMAIKGVVVRIRINTWGGEVQIWCEINTSQRLLTEPGEVWEGFLYPTKEELLKSL
jgi:hypothetical protein